MTHVARRMRAARTLLACALLLVSVLAQARPSLAETPEFSTVEELADKRIGVGVGSVFDQMVEDELPDAQLSYYNNISDMLAALKANRIDAAIADEPVIMLGVERNEGLCVMPERLKVDDYGYVCKKGSPLVAEFDEVLERYAQDGTLDALKEKWTGADEAAKVLPEAGWETPRGTLVYACDPTSEPLDYIGDDGTPTGYTVDLAMMICRELGYGIEVKSLEFSALLPSVESGKADFAGGEISITEERAEVVDFTVPDYYGAATFAVRDTDGGGASEPALEFSSPEEVVGKRIGMVSGLACDVMLMDVYPDIAEGDFSYFNSLSECIGALQKGKVDVVVTDLPMAEHAVARNTGIGIIEEPMAYDHYGFGLRKDSPLTAQFNERIAAYRADGTLDALHEEWIEGDDEDKAMPEADWDAPMGTLTVSTPADSEPMYYLSGNEVRGYSIELVEMICRDLGYGIDLRITNNASMISELESGRSDVLAMTLSITEERKQVIDITDSYMDGGLVAICRLTDEASEEDGGVLSGLGDSFRRTFVVEDRWRLIASGVGVTLLISVCSGALGLFLGFALVMLRRGGNTLACRLLDAWENLLGGLPMVVVLMVLYYVVFGSLNISGIVVAILAFTLVFGASAGSIMWNAIRAIDAGQTEAGRSLGFSSGETFRLVVLPQAARRFAPLLRGQFVSLIKDTSIVGYIAVQDLTRAGDLIRSRTMEAFFPLIAVALIYYAICRLLAWLVGLFIRRLEPQGDARTIKGVQL